MLERIVDAVVGLMAAVGAPGAALAVALENLFPPIPSEVVLPLAGFAAARGEFSLVSAIVWTTAGSLVGAVALYWLGRVWGADRLRRIADRLPLMKVADIDRTIDWFTRHGGKAVFLGRMLPVFRSLISVPAGVQAMPLPRFCLYTVAGSLIWNTVLISAGFLLGENWGLVERYVGVLSKVVGGLLVLAAVWFIARRLRRQRVAGE